MKQNIYAEIICGLLVVLFLYTALSKLSDFGHFRDTLGRAPLIGDYSNILDWMLPVAELITVALLLIPGWKLTGLYISLMLLLVFTGYLCFILLFKPHNLPCSCGGVFYKMSWQQHLVFNIIYLILSFIGITMFEKRQAAVKSPA